MIQHFENESGEFFYICNDSICCILKNENGAAVLVHLGAPVKADDAPALCLRPGLGWGCSVEKTPGSSQDAKPLAWSGRGRGDYRESPMELLCSGVNIVPDLKIETFRIYDGAPASECGLPVAQGECETLEIVLASGSAILGAGTKLILCFSLFETALVRRSVFINNSGKDIEITGLMSSMADIKGRYIMTTFNGGWISEMHAQKNRVTCAKCVNSSNTGFSSNRHNPGFILADELAGEDHGNVFGFNLIWSGNHYGSAQLSLQGYTRVLQGISPEGFSYLCKDGERFETPEAVTAFSDKGYNGMSRNMHAFVSRHIIPEYWQFRERPVLYNSWEGCMFDFNELKLLSLARKAKKLGCELFVLDDGWFGERNNDKAGLGDYNVNRKKIPGGMKGLADKIRLLGMDFGLWFEPEAVNPDSNLYREHPDWALVNEGVEEIYGRNEMLLDLTREDVRDYIVNSVSDIIDKAGIKYVKWDMNRHSCASGRKAYEYILGLYDVMRRIFGPREEVLLECCASGGNRFDLGMLCFAPQIWASDDTDPVERLDIQNGLSYLYPQSTAGAHISASPNAQTLRATPLSTRANAAFFGAFGLEMELGQLLPVEESELKETVDFYKQHRKTFQFGKFRRNRAEEGAVCWQVSDGEETIAGLFHRLIHAAPGHEWLYVSVDDKDCRYDVVSREQSMRVGQFGALIKHVAPVNINPNGQVARLADHRYKMADGSESFTCSGSALEAGVPLLQRYSGTGYDPDMRVQGDFLSNIYVIRPRTE